MLKILTYYALNYAADSQLITSSTVVSIAPQGYSVPHEESKKIVFAHFGSYLSN